MLIIPSINVMTRGEAERQLRQAAEFGATWIHLDIGDGIFTPNVTWGNPSEISNFQFLTYNPQVEVHLMVERLENTFLQWLGSGIERIIMHVEKVSDLDRSLAQCKEKNIELGLAISPDVPVEVVAPHLGKINFYQILMVPPGRAGQPFNPALLDRVRWLRAHAPNAIIEVDGGINLETAKLAKEAGADIIVSASYIWNSLDPKRAFEELQGL